MICPVNQTRAHASERPGPALVQDTKRALGCLAKAVERVDHVRSSTWSCTS
jgi:hypothetical protein